jgi:hypothetical protein
MGYLMARIQASKDLSGRIIVSFPYHPVLVSKVKTIDGRRWHPEEKHCSFLRLDVSTKSLGKIMSPLETLELAKGD